MRELVIDATAENLKSVLDFVYTALEESGCSEDLKDNVGIAAEEIFINIANYAYNPAPGSVSIRITVDSEITIEFEDSGTLYNPLETPEPNIAVPALEREIGGLGIFMVKQIMDSVEYRNENNRNILTIRKTTGRNIPV